MISIYSFCKLFAALSTLISFVFFIFVKGQRREGNRVTEISWISLVVSATALLFILAYGFVSHFDSPTLWAYMACGIFSLLSGYAAFYLIKLRDIKKRKLASMLIAVLSFLVFLSFFYSGYLRYESIITKPCPQGQVLNASDKGKMFKYGLMGGPINHVPFIRCVDIEIAFSPDNYGDTAEAMKYLVKKLPVGTDKETAEAFLVKKSGAVPFEMYPNTISYHFKRAKGSLFGININKCKGDWKFEISYDQDQKVQKVRFPCF
jgi:hypothetical protein